MSARPGTAATAFPGGPPGDPDYAPAEQGTVLNCLTKSAPGAEQHNLYSFIPQCTGLAKDPEGAAGMSVDTAWRDYSTGSPDTVIAYVEAGGNWHGSDVADLADKVYLNTGELPKPQGSDAYDKDGDGSVTAADYKDDSRVHDSNGNGVTDPEDLIVAFSDGKDDDGNGFTDDISGWDFYDDQNDPATSDATYGHANDQLRKAGAQTDNGNGTDTRPPGVLRDAQHSGTTVMFTAPGDDWYPGRVTSYRVTADGTTTNVPATVGAGGRQSVTVPLGAQKIVIQAVDDQGNLSAAANL